MFAPVSAGELFDKISILTIKVERIGDPAKRALAQDELTQLERIRGESITDFDLIAHYYDALREVNEALWDIEDHIRAKDRTGVFDAEFIGLARSVYRENDKRAELKRAINEALGSTIMEVKSYA